MLDDRSKLLLKALVERYIADGQPVGSRTLSKASGLELSPATIRNVMSDLEELGLIVSPHTSAGRVPTARGYRLFVDTMLTVQPQQFGSHILAPDQPQKVISNAANLLSSLSQFVGVVIAPRRTSAFRHMEFLRLSERRVLVIIVSPDGDVQNRILLTQRTYSPAELQVAANFLNEHYAGLDFDEIRSRLAQELSQLHQDMTSLMSAAVDAGSAAVRDQSTTYIISGEHNLLNVDDLSSNMARLRELFGLFDTKTGLLQLLEMAHRAEGVQLFIGNESGIAPLDECSVVAAPYEVDGEVVGSVGVIGPTRMAYERVIPIVDVTARLLSAALNSRR